MASIPTFDTVKNFLYSKTETQEVKDLREGLKLSMHTSKMVATAVLVISVISTLFSTLFLLTIGTPFYVLSAFCDFVVGGAIALIAYDATIAAEKGYQLADCPQHFTVFNGSPKSAVIKQCQFLVTEMLKETYILKMAQEFVFDRYFASLSELSKNHSS